MVKDLKGYVVKIAWADNNWMGFDQRGFENKELYGYRFVQDYGYAHEWWNYYEGFNSEIYYGRVEMRTPSKKIDDCLVLFISKNIYNNKFYFIGFYDHANYEKLEIDQEILELLPTTYIESIDKDKDDYIISVFNNRKIDPNFQGLKKFSTKFDKEAYLEVESNEVGIEKFGQAAFSYIGDGELCSPRHVLTLLTKVRNNHSNLLTLSDGIKKIELNSIIDKIDHVISRYFKSYWKIAPGERARLWEHSKKENTISIGWSMITQNLGDRLLDYKDYDEFKKDVDSLYDENKDKNPERFENLNTPAKRASVANQIWVFINDVKIGDIAVANKGTKKIIGKGIIKSEPWIDTDQEYAIIRRIKWIETDLDIQVPSSLIGKFNRTINKLKEEEYRMIFKEVTQKSEYELGIFKKIKEILDYKKQIILYGPPGTGKTFIARKFSEYHNKYPYYSISEAVIPDRKYYWWIIKPENWNVLDKGLIEKKLVQLKYEPGIRLKSAFEDIKEKDIVFIYKTSPIKQIKIIAECVSKEGNTTNLKLYGEIDGPSFDELKNNLTIKKSMPIRANLQGSLFEFEKEYVSELARFIKTDKIKDIEIFQEVKEIIKLTKTITFHQSYSYEEFIEGLKPSADDNGNLKFVVKEGLFKRACREAYNILLHFCNVDHQWNENGDIPMLTESERNKIQNVLKMNNYPICYFFIDEINRGDISRIFGELITLIEANKRVFEKEEVIATLPYSKKEFGVPINLNIIGTLNTSDRSIALLDMALRRRFGFIELIPDYKVLEKELLSDDLDDQTKNLRKLAIKFLETINKRIIKQYDRDHQIGHSYLLNLKEEKTYNESIEKLKTIIESEISPLLNEYFYDNPKVLKKVLNSVSIENIKIKEIEAILKKMSETKELGG